MNTVLTLLERKIYLERYPVKHQHKSLQAWDAADEYAIEHVESLLKDSELILAPHEIAIFNDDFGALACWFHKHHPATVGDSWVAHKSTKVNCHHNKQDPNALLFIDSLTDVCAHFSTPLKLVMLKLPRSMALLEYQLIQLQSVIDQDTVIVAFGKVKSVQTSVLKMFEKYIGETKTSLAKKKARLIFSQFTLSADKHSTLPEPKVVTDPDIAFSLYNYANTFSREQLDIGARLLLKHLPKGDNQKVCDLGCGNGVLGIEFLKHFPSAHVTFVDESYMALGAAKLSLEKMQGHTNNAKFVVSNCLEEVLKQEQEHFDHIVCNPPFHQQNVITDHIAYQMFNEAKRALRKGGEFRVVGNRHLDYPHRLNKLFDGHEVLGSDAKFSVMLCNKSY